MLTLDQLYPLIPAFILAAISSTVQLAIKTGQDATLTTKERAASTVGGLALVAIIATILVVVFNWNPLIVALLATVGGFVAEIGVRLFIKHMRASKDIKDFAERGKDTYDAFKSMNPTSKPEQSEPPKTE